MTFGNYAVDYEQRTYNPERMRNYRIERAQAALDEFGLGAMIVYDYDTHRYLGYYSTHQYARRRPGSYLLLIKGAGFPYGPKDHYSPMWETRLMPWFKDKFVLETSKMCMLNLGYPSQPDYMDLEFDKTAAEIKRFLEDHGVADMPCGVDMPNLRMMKACERAGIKLVDANPAIASMRCIKNEDEIACLRQAGVITESAHWEVCKALRPGITEFQVAGVAANALYNLGAEELEGPSFVVCSGPRSGATVPAMPTDRIIRPGDLLIIDINGVSFQGYRTCFYRTYCIGDKPTEFQKEIYNVAYEGLMALTDSIKPGITNHEANQAWLDKGKAPGLWGAGVKWPEPGRYFAGSTAHQIGLASGDPGPRIPGISPAAPGPETPPLMLQKNMTFAVEVGCFTWDGNQWARDGVKLEHCGVITDTGFEVFYRFPLKHLITCGLPGEY